MNPPSKPPDRPAKLNCWEFNQCGNGPPEGADCGAGGACPVAGSARYSGINDGRGAGRICWMLPATLCEGIPAGPVSSKIATCCECAFFRRVKAEEGEEFIRVSLGCDCCA